MPATAVAAGTAVSSGSWTWPREFPAPPGAVGGASFTVLSCVSRSDCTAAGIYRDRSGSQRSFVIAERRGAWGKLVGLAAPVAGKKVSFSVLVLSCASAGNCAAGGSYAAPGQQGYFVVSQANGIWGKDRKVRGYPDAISCPAPGECTAVLSNDYLLNERRGTWRTAFPVPGLAALHPGEAASPEVISCPSSGNCIAAGSYYETAAPYIWSFLATETRGIWGDARPVKSLPGAGLDITAVSCPSAGNCVAGGPAYSLAGSQAGFAIAQTRGTWGAAGYLPGTAKLRGGISQLDCPTAGACSASGSFPVGRLEQPFVSTEKNGTWHNAQPIAGARPDGPSLHLLSCSAVGRCVLAGAILLREFQAASAAQVNGRWGPARMLRGILAIDQGKESLLEALSCPPRSRCTAVGSFATPGSRKLFITTQR